MAGVIGFEDIIWLIKRFTGKSHIKLLARGNEAILWALEITAALGRKKVLIQDQGGWLTYLTYPKKFGMKIVKVKTDYGVLDSFDLQSKAGSDSVLLINSMPGYLAIEDMKKICKVCEKKDTIVINDVSGSIGTDVAKFGDIIVGSFGKWKPIWVGHGGFIAAGQKWFSEGKDHTFNKEETQNLLEALRGLKKRIKYLEGLSYKTKKDLKKFDVIHRQGKGFNIAVKYSSDKEKDELIEYCDKNDLECTICPRYIRVNEKAICIELKREKEEVKNGN